MTGHDSACSLPVRIRLHAQVRSLLGLPGTLLASHVNFSRPLINTTLINRCGLDSYRNELNTSFLSFPDIKGCRGQCQNGGTCKVRMLLRTQFHSLCPASPPPNFLSVLKEGPKGHRCLCLPGFAGAHCEIQRNKCASRPCQNGGQCHTVLDSFVCQCPPKFAGQLCEVRPDHPRS